MTLNSRRKGIAPHPAGPPAPAAPAWTHNAVASIGELLLGKEESSALRHRLVTGAAGLLGLRFVFSGLSFALTILLARLLGPEDFGAYNYALAWVLLLVIPAILGTDQLLVREVASYTIKGDWGLLRGLLRKANWAVLLASVGIAVLVAAVCWALSPHWSPRVVSTLWVALLLLPLITLTQVRRGALQGLHRIVLGSVPENLIKPGLLLAFLGVAYLLLHRGLFQGRLTAPLAMGLNVFATGVAFAIGTWLLYRLLPQAVKDAAPAYRDSAWLRSALPLMFLASMGVAFAQADTLILGAIKGAGAVGIYSAADKGAELLTIFLVAQNAAFASTAASLYAAGDLKGLQRLVTRLARLTLAASLPLAVVLIVFGHWFLRFFYGPQFAQAQMALTILTLGQIVNVGAGSVGILLTMTGHERDCAVAIGAAAVANIGLNLLLVPEWGWVGAAVGNTISMVLWNVWMAISLSRKVGIHSTAWGRVR
jgi:O-antigen/teichoic acid export membrane protein